MVCLGDREGDGSLDPGLPVPIYCGVTLAGASVSAQVPSSAA